MSVLTTPSPATRFEESVLAPVLTGRRADGARPRWWLHPLTVLIAGAIYGGAMGSWSIETRERLLLIPYAAIKVPMLILVTTLICLPGYFVLSTVIGLRSDFRAALAAIAAGQAAVTLALCSLAPVTRFVYFSGIGHAEALVLSAAMFALSTCVGYAVMLRRYRPLLQKSRRHRAMLAAWISMYVFVGIQMGWMLRPFVGTPGMPVAFVRQEPLSNAYVAVSRIILQSVREIRDGRGSEKPEHRPYR
jgi:hypothetical protein